MKAPDKKQTSVSIDRQLWQEFGAVLRLQGVPYSQAIERLIAKYLAEPAPEPLLEILRAQQRHLTNAIQELEAIEPIPSTSPRALGK